ncbi:helix-turn-helix transcriptional regulator [Virgibacillus necropolis]|uniref:Transcriptional regulator n=1 Tax=Virgibacillus necropolis TaxID=163877 RepID=A0A221MCE4_9BACI|nr:helix-turn-helix transcriptional regulator [Virgibacillus necropolis]ASN05315.1 transcriptional regulator [Virgibacillus necropolis]
MIISLIGSYIKQSPYDRPYICEYMEVSNNTLSSWCTGKHYPSIPQLFKLANLLGVSIADLYQYKT